MKTIFATLILLFSMTSCVDDDLNSLSKRLDKINVELQLVIIQIKYLNCIFLPRYFIEEADDKTRELYLNTISIKQTGLPFLLANISKEQFIYWIIEDQKEFKEICKIVWRQ